MRRKTSLLACLLLRPSDAVPSRPPFDVSPAGDVFTALHDQEGYLQAQSAFRSAVLNITGMEASPEKVIAFCRAVSDVLPAIGFATTMDTFNAMEGIDAALDLDAAGVSRGARHIMGTVAMNDLLKAYSDDNDEGTAARRDAAAVTMFVTAKASSDGPMKAGLDAMANMHEGAQAHSVLWTYLTGVGHLSPHQLWATADAVCATMFNTNGYNDCLHGVGHAAVMLPLIAEGRAKPTGAGSCTYWRALSVPFSRPVVERAVQYLDAAPTPGMAVAASRGMWMCA